MDEPQGSNRGKIAALVFVVLLVLGALWLQAKIRADAKLQDCVMSGRTNCAQVGTTGG
jgi:hypothetical protein